MWGFFLLLPFIGQPTEDVADEENIGRLGVVRDAVQQLIARVRLLASTSGSAFWVSIRL